MRFAGKCVVLTGAGTGIGASAARMFVEEGAEVIAVQNRVPAEHGARRVTMDLGDPGSIRAAAAEIPARIDILCNIAGIGSEGGAPDQIIMVNFIGTRLFTELMLERAAPGGCVLNTASVAGRNWRRDVDHVRQVLAMRGIDEVRAFWATLDREHQYSYSLSKAAVIAWTLKLARDHKTGPRCNVLSPGFTDTPMLQHAYAEGNEAVRNLAQSNTHVSTPDDVAKVALFLCSDEAATINGAEILADGGLMATMVAAEFGL
jgi:NAD(P)-dependent dehydrogenase (short-subunit alcohol dehydrogenase family)